MSKASNPLDFERLLELSDLQRKTLADVPRWPGVEVEIIELSAADVTEARKVARKGKEFDEAVFNKELFRRGVVSPQLTLEQIDKLYRGSQLPLNYITRQLLDLSGLGEEAEKDAEESFPAEG